MTEMSNERLLDWMVAEKVMGYKVQETDDCNGEDNLWIDPANALELPFYSTNIHSAMEVFTKLRNSGKWCCLKIDSDYNFIWYVKLTRTELKDENPNHDTTIWEQDEESLPLAICRAALKAVEYEEKSSNHT
jgi:hypothetical protein